MSAGTPKTPWIGQALAVLLTLVTAVPGSSLLRDEFMPSLTHNSAPMVAYTIGWFCGLPEEGKKREARKVIAELRRQFPDNPDLDLEVLGCKE